MEGEEEEGKRVVGVWVGQMKAGSMSRNCPHQMEELKCVEMKEVIPSSL